MRSVFVLMLCIITQSVIAQNSLNWRNNFPDTKEEANDEHIYSEGVKLNYDNGLVITSTTSDKKVGETIMRREDAFVKYTIFDADIEMKFAFLNGAASTSALGMEFDTYPGGRVITYRFLLNADGVFYTNIDSADYSPYKNSIDQFTAKQTSAKLFLDGTENTLVISRHNNYWIVKANGQHVDSIKDYRYYQFNPANGIKFIYSGKYKMKLNALTEDYGLLKNKSLDDLKLLKPISGNGWVIEDLNTTDNSVVDNNATMFFEMVNGRIRAYLVSTLFVDTAIIFIQKADDDKFEISDVPSVIEGYTVVEFDLDPEEENWYFKAELISGDYQRNDNDFVVTETYSKITTTLWLRGNKK